MGFGEAPTVVGLTWFRLYYQTCCNDIQMWFHKLYEILMLFCYSDSRSLRMCVCAGAIIDARIPSAPSGSAWNARPKTQA